MADDVKGPEMFWQMMRQNLNRAEAEILRKIAISELVLPADPANALRLLGEYVVTADKSFRPTTINPDGYAQIFHMLAFEEELASSAAWPYSQTQMNASFCEAGLIGDLFERIPMTHRVAVILLSRRAEFVRTFTALKYRSDTGSPPSWTPMH